jgi:drug/metabolite transporter (DMT)-like permease
VEWSLLAVLSVLWGATFFLVEIALVDLGPLTIVAGRVGLAALVLVAIVHVAGLRLPTDTATWGAFAVMGLLNNTIPFSLIFWGQVEITASLASILNALPPVFAVVLAPLFLADERITAGRLVGVAFGVLGVAVLIGPTAIGDLGVQVLAQLAIVGSSLSYALASIHGRRFAGRPPLVAAAGQLVCSAVMMIPLAMIVEGAPIAFPGGATIAAVVALAILGTAVAYVLYFRVLATAGATNLMLVTLLVPISAILFAAAFLGERVEPLQLAGMALIGLGLVAIDGRPWQFLAARFRT